MANEAGDRSRRWKEFLQDPDFGFHYIVGVSGTCYVADLYFTDVVFRYSLRQAIEQRFVKKVEYIAEMPETSAPDEKWQLVLQRHHRWKRFLRSRGIKPLTIVVTKGIRDAKRVAEELTEFLQEHESLSAEVAAEKVLTVTSASEGTST